MALALSVALEPVKLGAILTASGLPAGTTTLTIERTSPSGAVAGVRGAVGVATGGASSFTAHDYELPLDTTVSYKVTAYNASGASLGTASAIFSIVYGLCEAWLVDIARPTNSLQLVIESMVELDFGLPSGIHRVLDRRAPVVTALPAWTPSSELVVLTETLQERDQLRALLGSGYPFLLRTEPEQGIGNMYLALSEFVEERFLTPGVASERRFRISVVQVERPDPQVYVPVAPNTYANVKASFATYAALKAGVASYGDLAYIYPPGTTSPIIPWLPDDV